MFNMYYHPLSEKRGNTKGPEMVTLCGREPSRKPANQGYEVFPIVPPVGT